MQAGLTAVRGSTEGGGSCLEGAELFNIWSLQEYINKSISSMPTLYADMVSQPCRAIAVFCQLAGIEFELKEISLAKQEHKTEDYTTNVHKFG